jgi:hypothetical protein
MGRPMRDLLLILIGTGACLPGTACDDKKPSADAPRAEADAGSDKYATVDPKLAKALQAAAGGAGSDDGPPPDGVFPPGGAERRHAMGVPTKVELVNDGAEPRVAFRTDIDASADAFRIGSYGPAALEIAMQLGPRVALPTIDLSLSFGPAKGDREGPEWLSAIVRKALPSQEQLSELPPDGAHMIASLEGTQILIKLTPDGRESDAQTVLGKTAQPELDRVAKNAADALVLATVPMPPKAIGVGAQWIAETRMEWSGLDVIAYRAFRVKSIDGERLDLGVDVKAYAASRDTQLQGIPPGAVLKQFEAEAQGEMTAVRGEAFARKFEMQERVVFLFSSPTPPEGQPSTDPAGRPEGNTLTGQVQAAATFVRGDELRAAAERGRLGRK